MRGCTVDQCCLRTAVLLTTTPMQDGNKSHTKKLHAETREYRSCNENAAIAQLIRASRASVDQSSTISGRGVKTVSRKFIIRGSPRACVISSKLRWDAILSYSENTAIPSVDRVKPLTMPDKVSSCRTASVRASSGSLMRKFCERVP